MRFPNAAKGINKIWIAEILGIVAAVLAIVMVILTAANHIDPSLSAEAATQAIENAQIGTPFVILSVVMMLIMLVSYILNLIGIVNASKDEEGFKNALWVLLGTIVFGIVSAVTSNSNPRVSNWTQVPATLLELVVTMFVLEGIGNLAGVLGKQDIADLAAQCRTWLMSALVLSAAAQVFVSLGTQGSTLNTASGIAASLLQIFAYVVYIRVLAKARKMQ